MNPIIKALDDIKFKIPTEILEEAFYKNLQSNRTPYISTMVTPVNLDYLIRQKVIERKVKTDLNLIGGNELEVDLSGITPEYVDNWGIVYRIPKSYTENRLITTIKNVTVGTRGAIGYQYNSQRGYSLFADAASQVLGGQEPTPVISISDISLIAENTVLIRAAYSLPYNVYLRCILEYDEDFSQFDSRTVIRFSELCVLATKAYIYNLLTIKIGQGQLSGGQELGRFKEIIESYSDAITQYDEIIRRDWGAITILDDKIQKQRHLKSIITFV